MFIKCLSGDNQSKTVQFSFRAFLPSFTFNETFVHNQSSPIPVRFLPSMLCFIIDEIASTSPTTTTSSVSSLAVFIDSSNRAGKREEGNKNWGKKEKKQNLRVTLFLLFLIIFQIGRIPLSLRYALNVLIPFLIRLRTKSTKNNCHFVPFHQCLRIP